MRNYFLHFLSHVPIIRDKINLKSLYLEGEKVAL